MVQVVRTPSKSKRWVEHFSELLNQPSEVDTTILKEIEQLPIDESLDVPITEDKLDESLKNNKDSRMYMEGSFERFLFTAISGCLRRLEKLKNYCFFI